MRFPWHKKAPVYPESARRGVTGATGPQGRGVPGLPPGWQDNEPVRVGECPQCGLLKIRPHPLDRCHGEGGTAMVEGYHEPVPLIERVMTMQRYTPDADLPELVRRLRYLLIAQDAAKVSPYSFVGQVRKALDECDPEDEFPFRED